MKNGILVISFSDLKRDPRVYRQLSFLKQRGFKITALGLVNPNIDDVEFIQVQPDRRKDLKNRIKSAIELKLGKFEQYYWSSAKVKTAKSLLLGKNFDLIITNDLNSLPLAVKLAKAGRSKLLLDAHEYEPKRFDENLNFRFFFQAYWDYICRTYLSHTDAMVTVCDGIAQEYQRNYGVQPSVVTNAPLFQSIRPSFTNQQRIRMIHHGGVNRVRRLENMIQLMDRLDERFTLDFMLVPNQIDYVRELKQLGSRNSRINFIDPVPMPEISSFINQYDIGLYMLPPNSFNCRMALPNKLFEFIQGRLAVAIWPSPEMAKVVRHYQCGVVSEEFSIASMAKALNQLTTDQVSKLKQNSDKAASEVCAEKNFETLDRIISGLLSPA